MVKCRYDGVFFDLYGTLVDAQGQAIAGAGELVRALTGAKWAVVTSCPGTLARSLLENAKLPEPPALVAAEHVTRGKPAPDPYRLAARRLGVRPESSLAVEDSWDGALSALAAGMAVVGIRRGRAVQFPAGVEPLDALHLLRISVNGAAISREQ